MLLRKIGRTSMQLLLLGLVVAVALAVPLSAQLARSATPPLPPAKQAIQDRLTQMRLAAINAPKTGKDYQPPVSLPVAWPSGIIESAEAPFSTLQYKVDNEWVGVVGTSHAIAYAGAEAANPVQGVLILQTISFDLRVVQSFPYLTPTPTGALRLVSANATTLVLAAQSGEQYSFDLVTRTLNHCACLP